MPSTAGSSRSIQAFHDAVETGPEGDASDALLVRMYAYAEAHFATEESFLHRHGYPDLDDHAGEHQAYVDQLAKLAQRRRDRTLEGSKELIHFLEIWWREHILKSDMAYRDWLREQRAR